MVYDFFCSLGPIIDRPRKIKSTTVNEFYQFSLTNLLQNYFLKSWTLSATLNFLNTSQLPYSWSKWHFNWSAFLINHFYAAVDRKCRSTVERLVKNVTLSNYFPNKGHCVYATETFWLGDNRSRSFFRSRKQIPFKTVAANQNCCFSIPIVICCNDVSLEMSFSNLSELEVFWSYNVMPDWGKDWDTYLTLQQHPHYLCFVSETFIKYMILMEIL